MSKDNVSTALRQAAEAGTPGDRLPSVRELARRHRASPVTVQRALTALAAEGLVVPRPGRGTFVAERRAAPGASADLGWQALALGEARVDPAGLDELALIPDPSVLALSAGYFDAPLQPHAALAAATSRAARRPESWSRPPAEGIEPLRAWFAREAGGALTAHDMVIASGAQAAMSTIFRALAAPGEPVVLESPTYPGAMAAARSAGLRVVPVAVDEGGVPPERLADAFARSGARLAYLQPDHANPHGASLSAERRAAIVAVAEEGGAFLIEDDWGRDLSFEDRVPGPLVARDEHGHVVYVRSLTKAAAPGLRIAAVGARGAAGARMRAARVVDDLFVSGVLQAATLELVSSPAWKRHLRAVRATLVCRRDALLAALREHAPLLAVAAVPQGGLHLWAQLPEGVDEAEVAARAAAAGVLVTPGRHFFPGEAPGAFLRLTFAGAPEAQLVAGVKKLAKLL